MFYQIVYRQSKYEIVLPETEAFDFDHLKTHIVEAFLELTKRWRVMYLDDEHEAITISSNEELREAYHVQMESSSLKTVKLFLVPQPSIGDRFHGLSNSLAKLILVAKNGTLASANRCAGIGRDTLYLSTKHTKNLVQRSKAEISLRMSRLSSYLRKPALRPSYKKLSSDVSTLSCDKAVDKSQTLRQQTSRLSIEPEEEPVESMEAEVQDDQPEPNSDVDTDCDSEHEVEPSNASTSWNQSILSLTYA